LSLSLTANIGVCDGAFVVTLTIPGKIIQESAVKWGGKLLQTDAQLACQTAFVIEGERLLGKLAKQVFPEKTA
jgi:hypothetical protein